LQFFLKTPFPTEKKSLCVCVKIYFNQRCFVNWKRVFAIVVFIVGVAMVGGAYYINTQVAEGKLQVSSAEKKVDQGKTLFSLNPVSKEIGDQITKSADRKIDKAKEEISYYAGLAQNLQIGGIVLIVIGIGFFIFAGRSKKS
jgi:hypothetical protein